MLEGRAFVKQEVPPPATGGGCGGKVQDPQLGADVYVGAPDAVGSLWGGLGVVVDVL